MQERNSVIYFLSAAFLFFIGMTVWFIIENDGTQESANTGSFFFIMALICGSVFFLPLFHTQVETVKNLERKQYPKFCILSSEIFSEQRESVEICNMPLKDIGVEYGFNVFYGHKTPSNYAIMDKN